MSFEPQMRRRDRVRAAAEALRGPRRLLLAALLLCGLAGVALALQAVRQVRARAAANAAPDLATLAPPGALLAIQSPDFAALLGQWNGSAEQKAWLASANYSVFTNSRLFGRLGDAEGEFAKASGVPAAQLLPQVAGRQSLFAWYDVGNLEFLYITRMAPGKAAASDLLRQRARFSQRSAGGVPFYVRTANNAAAGTHRTVAFATTGDLLLLATREDLMAGALERLARNPKEGGDSLGTEPWFAQAAAALPAAPAGGGGPVLHMVLNLQRIVPMPYFHSYWIQGNVTAMSRFRASAADLYEAKDGFREERALLPAEEDEADQGGPAGSVPAGSGPAGSGVGLASLAALAPPGGVFRARATGDPADAVAELDGKLLGRAGHTALPSTTAADPSLSSTPAGQNPDAAGADGTGEDSAGAGAEGASAGTSDLDTRIDTPPPVSAAASDKPLGEALRAAGLDAVLSWSAAGPVDAPKAGGDGGLWIPVHAAVVLRGRSAWNVQAIAAALEGSLRGSLTAGTLGIDFHPEPGAAGIFSLTGPKPLLFAVHDGASGHLLLLADTRALLQELLRRADSRPGSQTGDMPDDVPGATVLAGFDHEAARAPYARLTGLIDGTAGKPNAGEAGVTPALFSQNLRSLSDAFAALASERFAEQTVHTQAGTVVRQTVLYRWQSGQP